MPPLTIIPSAGAWSARLWLAMCRFDPVLSEFVAVVPAKEDVKQ